MSRPEFRKGETATTVQWGRVYARLTRRPDERRLITWAGIGVDLGDHLDDLGDRVARR